MDISGSQTSNVHLLSMQQKALWFLARYSPDNFNYNIALAFNIHESLQRSFKIEIFRQAVNRLVAKNELLRTTFVSSGGEPSVVINECLPPVFKVFDARKWSKTSLEQALQAFYEKPFELHQGSCLRVGIYVISAEAHVLLLCTHHIVSDFTSLGLILDQLEHFYLAEIEAEGDSWLPPTEAFKEYLLREQSYYRSEVAEKSAAYWIERLKNQPAMLHWSSFWCEGDTGPSSLFFMLGEKITRKIKQLAARVGGTTFTILLATWSVYLAKETSTSEIVIGVPVSTRDSASQNTIGCLFNVLPIRLSVESTFYNCILAAKEQLLTALDNQQFSLSQILNHLEVERCDGRNPLFQTTINRLGHAKQSRWSDLMLADASKQILWAGFTLSPVTIYQQEGQVDIALDFVEADHQLRCVVKGSKHFFSYSGLQILVDRFKEVVETLMAAPDHPLSSLLGLASKDYNLPRGPLNTHVPLEISKQTVVSRFDQWVTQQATSVAIQQDRYRVTYADLQRWSLGVAAQLVKHGVAVGERVGVAVIPSVEAVVAMLGIMRAGGGYVPLDPGWPQQRLQKIVVQSAIKLIVTDRDSGSDHDGLSPAKRICLTAIDEVPASIAFMDNSQSCSIAYSVFTSGSTGYPKGIDVDHSNVIACLRAMDNCLTPIGPGEVWSWFHAASFDLSVWELWGALCAGGTLIIVPEALRNQPDKFLNLVEAAQVTIVTQTPSGLKNLLSEFQSKPRRYAIKHWIVCGEALSGATARPYLNRQWNVWNLYGPAETTVFASVEKITAELAEQPVIPIGKPLAFANIYLFDADMQVPAVGETGEIYIGGHGVSRGYVGLASLSTDCFIANPYNKKERLYKTGDLAYWDGERLHFFGRVDDQIKISGYRIEVAEVESCLNRYSAIADAAITVSSGGGSDYLVAIVVPAGKNVLFNEAAIRTHLAAHLPFYMLPNRILVADSLPTNAHNKIDRNALKALLASGELKDISSLSSAPSIPSGSMFSEISKIWCEVLGRSTVKLDDAFFDIGGNSLALMRVHAQIVQLPGGSALAPSDLFRFPTIRLLVNYLLNPQLSMISTQIGVQPFHTRRRKTCYPSRSSLQEIRHTSKGE